MPFLTRRHVLAALAAGVVNAGHACGQSARNDIEQRLTQAQRDGRVSGLHALLVSEGWQLVFEYYGRSENELFGPNALHDLRSVSKSVVALVYGIALAAGKVPAPEAKLYEQFPEYSGLAVQADRKRLTGQHALNMTLGLEWDIVPSTPAVTSRARAATLLFRPFIRGPRRRLASCSAIPRLGQSNGGSTF